MKEVFTNIFKNNLWTDSESVSWPGSNSKQTKNIVYELPKLFDKLNVKSVLDIPCWDFNWFRTELEYIWADIVDEIIESNKIKHPDMDFRILDITKDHLPNVDMILVRDCLVHFSYEYIWNALKNICLSNSKYLLATTFPGHENSNISIGNRFPLNFQKPPFNFPPPKNIINEWCIDYDWKYTDKSLWLWEIDTIRNLLSNNI